MELGTRPIWFLNMCSLGDWNNPQAHISSLAFWSPYINRWMDATLVKGNADAEAVVRVCLRLFNRIGIDFSRLREDIADLKKTHRRLKGLA